MRAVITFHAIDEAASPLSFPPATLAMLLAGLGHAGLPVVTLDALLTEAKPGVALTFDDGMASVFAAALPILRDFAVPAHLFLTTGVVGGDNGWPGQPASAQRYAMLDWAQIEALHGGGVRIEGHTDRHPDLRMLPAAAIDDEMDRADALIERRLGRRPRYFAYPYGYHDAGVRAVAARRYAASFTTDLDFIVAGAAAERLPRLDSHYLRSPWLVQRLDTRIAKHYVTVRRAIRALRGNN